MSKQQKQIAIVAAAALGLYLLYRWYQSNQSTAAASTAAPDTSGSDYASLAGQEQSDVAALQGQEQSDVANLSGQEQSDVGAINTALSGITSTLGTVTNTLNTVAGNQTTDEATINALASGQQQLDRSVLGTIQPKPGGAFARYYQNVTGHAPPANVNVTNFIYQAWKAGVKATALRGSSTHPSAPKNTQVQHPNSNHTQKTGNAGKTITSSKTTQNLSKTKKSTSKSGRRR